MPQAVRVKAASRLARRIDVFMVVFLWMKMNKLRIVMNQPKKKPEYRIRVRLTQSDNP
ncbi:hypothetical protein D9M68_878750 [compost metagenome]